MLIHHLKLHRILSSFQKYKIIQPHSPMVTECSESLISNKTLQFIVGFSYIIMYHEVQKGTTYVNISVKNPVFHI